MKGAERVETLFGVRGQKALDIGTGTGVMPRNMYGYGADWTGVDISQNEYYCKKIVRFLFCPRD